MGTISHDFTTGSVEAPISFSGAYEVLYGTAGTQAPQLKDNGGNVNAAPNNTSSPAAVGITSGTATFGQKQYSEITVGANWTNFNSIGGGVFLSSGNNGYYLSLDRPYASNSANRVKKVVSGTVTSLSPTLSGITWAIGDKLGLLGEEVAGTVTLTLYRNPTGYDGDGFPSDGSVASTTDTDLTSGVAGLVAFRGSGTTAYATDAYYAGTAAATGLTIDSTDASMQRNTNFQVVCSTPTTTPTTGNTTLTNGNDTLTPTSVTGSDPYTITFPVGDLTKQVDATGYDWTLTVDAETATTGNIPLVIQSGYTLVDLVDPVTTDASLLFGAVGTPVTTDHLEYIITSTLDSGVTLSDVAANGVWTVTEAVEGDWVTDITVSRRVVQAGGTIGTEAVLTLQAPTSAASGLIVSAMVSNIVSNMVN